MEQFEIVKPKLNKKATRKAVVEVLEMYQMVLLTQDEEKLPSVTAAYSIVPPTETNENHSSTEEAAIENVERERARNEFIHKVVNAINRLTEDERILVVKEYVDQNQYFNYEIYNDLGISESKYYKIKGKALEKMAFMLDVQVISKKVSQ